MSITKDLRPVVGKRVESITLNPWRAYPDVRGDRTMAYNPVIRFHDGSTLRFVVQETDTGEYGIKPTLYPPPEAL